MKSRSSFESKVSVAFVAAAIVVVALALATWKLARDAQSAARWVNHTQEVIKDLSQAKVDALSVELSSPNYRVSGDPAHLALRDATIRSREETLVRLDELTKDDPRQQESLAQLRKVIDERLAIARDVERVRGSQGAEAAAAVVASSGLAETRERLYNLLDGMRTTEDQRLAERTAAQSFARQSLLVVGALSAAMLFVLLAATFILIRRQLRETRQAQRDLAHSREDLLITLQSIGDAVLATDRQGRVTRMNPVAEKLTGWTFAEAEGHPIGEVFNIVNELTRAPAPIPVSEVIRTGEQRGLANHTTIISRDGAEYPIADSAAPIRDFAGQIRGAVLVFRDVTLEHQAQRIVRDQNALLARRVEERTAELRESEEHLRSVINNVPAMIAYVGPDLRYVYVNRQYQEGFLPGSGDLVGRTVKEVLGEARYQIAQPRIEKVLKGEPQSYDWMSLDGVWQSISYIPRLDAQNRQVGYYVLGADITQRKRAEAEIHNLNKALTQRLIDLEHVSRALRALDAGNRAQLQAGTEHDLLDAVCRAIAEAGGYPRVTVWYYAPGESQSLTPIADSGIAASVDILAAHDASMTVPAGDQSALARAVRTGQTVCVERLEADPAFRKQTELPPGCASGVFCPLRVDGIVIGAIAIMGGEPEAMITDEVALLTQSANDLAIGISTHRAREEKRKTQEALLRLTRYDALTDLPNETLFAEHLIDTIRHCGRLGQPFGILQANIDRLSEVNLAFGFAYGDQVLREFSNRLQSVVADKGTVARLRGDEFAILVPGCDSVAMQQLAQDVESVLQTPFRFGEVTLDVSARFGIAVFPDHGGTPHELLRSVDIAVHQASQRNSEIVVYDAARIPDHSSRLKLAGELRSGIRAGELRLFLQPKVDMATGRVCGAEALVRWMHPINGLVCPADFIELAENAGLIDSITIWVINAALAQIMAMQKQGCAVPVSVNLSVRNLHDKDLVRKVCDLLARYDVPASLFELEVTESAAMEDPLLALAVLQDLRREGILLSIDDFGTGYSSLSYLQKLPVDYIKIDQSFVRDMSSSEDSSLIVRSTIDLVRDLGRKTVAEGVETREHWEQLARYGCDLAQGYFIAAPMPADAFVGWMRGFKGPDPE